MTLGRQHEASSHFRRRQEREHPRRAGRPLGKPIAESSALCIPTAQYGHPRSVRVRGHGVSSVDDATIRCASWVGSPWECWSSRAAQHRRRTLGPPGPRDRGPAGGGRRCPVPVLLDAAVRAGGSPAVAERDGLGGTERGEHGDDPSIGEDFVEWKPPTGGDETLGVVDFSICPHVNPEGMPGNSMAEAERWAAASRVRPTR